MAKSSMFGAHHYHGMHASHAVVVKAAAGTGWGFEAGYD